MYYGWILLGAIGFIYMVCIGAGFYGLSVTMPVMIDDLGWTRAEATTGFAILSIVVGLSGPIITTLMKRIGPRLTIVIGGVVSASGASIVYFDHSLPMYYLATAIIGCGLTMQAVLPGTMLVTQWFHQRRSMALGLFMAAGGMGGVVGAPAFTWILHHFDGWRAAWVFIALISLTASLLSWIVVRNQPEDVGQILDGVNGEDTAGDQAKVAAKAGVYKTNRDWTVKEAFRDSTYRIILISGALAVTGHMMVTSQLVLHVKDLGMTALLAASALGIQGLFTTSGRFLSGLLGDYTIEPRSLFFYGLASEFIGMLMLTNAHYPFLLYTSVIFFGLGFGLGLVGSTAMLANYYGPENTPALLSYRILLGTLLGGIGVVVAGYCGDIYGGYQEVFYGFSGFLLFATLLVLLIKIPEIETDEVEST